jgi:hypothetical protein
MNEGKYDFTRAQALLAIVKDVAGVAPQFTAISGEAMAELKELNDALLREKTKIKAPAHPGQPVAHPVPSQPIDHVKGTEEQQKRAEEEKRKAEEAEREEERKFYEKDHPKAVLAEQFNNPTRRV